MSRRRGGQGDGQWRIVFRLFEHLRPDDIVTYEQLYVALDTDNLAKVRQLVSRAKREMWSELGRSVAAVPDVGYRMIRADEHSLQARGYELAARRRVGDAIAVVQNAHLEELDDVQREGMVKVQMGMRLLARAMDESYRRLNEHDNLIAGLQHRVNQLEHQHPEQLEGPERHDN